MKVPRTLSVLAATAFVLLTTAGVVIGFFFLIRSFPYIGVPLLVVVVILGWWRVYDTMMRRAEAAYDRQRKGRGK